jgi:hypothetical protein
MAIEALVRPGDELPVEAPFAAAGFVSRREENGPPVGVEGEGDPPDATPGKASQFLHVRVPGPAQGVGMRPAKLRAFPLEKGGPCENGVLHIVRERIELGLKRVKELDDPMSCLHIVPGLYSVKTIFQARSWRARSRSPCRAPAWGRPVSRSSSR